MRIALNAWFIDQPATGSGQYLAHLLTEYAVCGPDHRFLLCVHGRRGPSSWPVEMPQGQEAMAASARDRWSPTQGHACLEWNSLRTPFDRTHRHLCKLWFEQVGFPVACRRWGADVVHVPYWASPLFARRPVVVTIHDLIPYLLPEYGGGTQGRLYTWLVALSARRAAAVLTDSAASRQDILRHLRVAPERVEAIPLAPDPRCQPVSDTQALERVRAKYALPARYLLYLGGFDVRKNVRAVLCAFGRLETTDVRLVVGGKLPVRDTAFSPDPRRIAGELGIADRVCFAGWVDPEDTPALYSGAIAFAFPSTYEGFGLPPLEAMACGTPVIVSNRSSLPEVIGDGGVYIDPDDTEALAAAMRILVNDGTLRQRLGEVALAQARRFSWQQTALATMSVYHRVWQHTPDRSTMGGAT